MIGFVDVYINITQLSIHLCEDDIAWFQTKNRKWTESPWCLIQLENLHIYQCDRFANLCSCAKRVVWNLYVDSGICIRDTVAIIITYRIWPQYVCTQVHMNLNHFEFASSPFALMTLPAETPASLLPLPNYHHHHHHQGIKLTPWGCILLPRVS